MKGKKIVCAMMAMIMLFSGCETLSSQQESAQLEAAVSHTETAAPTKVAAGEDSEIISVPQSTAEPAISKADTPAGTITPPAAPQAPAKTAGVDEQETEVALAKSDDAATKPTQSPAEPASASVAGDLQEKIYSAQNADAVSAEAKSAFLTWFQADSALQEAYATDTWTWEYFLWENGNTELRCYGPESTAQSFLFYEGEVSWGPTGQYR